MVQQVSVQYVDDVDGSVATASVDFSLDGKAYSIDLSDGNAAKLRAVLAPYVAAARRPGRAARPSSAGARRSGEPGRSRDETQAMRSWLRNNGYTVKDRGRVPVELVAAYETRTAATPAAPGRSAGSKRNKREKVNSVEFSGG